MWLVNYHSLLLRAFGFSILWNACCSLRVNIPKEAQAYRDKLISDALSYSYSALEFGASNETQFKTWSVVKNLSQPGYVNKTLHEYGYEDSRWPSKKHKVRNHNIPSSKPKLPLIPPQSRRPSGSPPQFVPLPEINPQYGFHPLLFSLAPTAVPVTTAPLHRHPSSVIYHEFRSSTLAPLPSFTAAIDQPRVIINGILGGDKKPHYKQLGRIKKGKARNVFRKSKLRPVGLDHFNNAVHQVLYNGLDYRAAVTPRSSSTTTNPYPKLSPGYSRVTQNLPNSLPAIIFSTNQNGETVKTVSRNVSSAWIPIMGPTNRPLPNNKTKKIVNLSRVLKNKSRPRHRYSSNYASRSSQMLKVQSHRLAGIINQTMKSATEVMTIYPSKTSNGTTGSSSLSSKSSSSSSSSSRSVTSTLNTTENGQVTTTGEPPTTDDDIMEIIHATITKIPNRNSADVVLNVTTTFPIELDERARARLKAIRKIVRRLP